MVSCQKQGIILAIKIEKNILSKNVNNKKCAIKLVSCNERKFEKDSDDF